MTHHRSPEMLPDGSITQSDRAVLANAVCLLAAWLERFAAERTIEGSSHAPSGSRPFRP
jgi:serine protease inhibitor